MNLIPALLPLAALFAFTATAQKQAEPAMCRIEIYADQPGATISKDIYGHFAEHLGHCIYEGIWVGKDGWFGESGKCCVSRQKPEYCW